MKMKLNLEALACIVSALLFGFFASDFVDIKKKGDVVDVV